jgi:predicted PurR-regulated permease PerM
MSTPETLSRLQLSQIKAVSGSTLTFVAIGVVVVAALYLGREVLVPIALAILLSFVLSPLVRILRSWYFPRAVAVLLVVFVAFLAIFALGTLMVAQVNELASDLPRYQYTLQEKIDSLRGGFSGAGTLERASEVLQDLKKEIEKPKAEQAVPSIDQSTQPNKPVPVQVVQPDPGALQTLAALIAPLIHPLTTTGIVVIFVIFILLQQHDLRNRLVRLAGASDLQRTTAALDDAGERLSQLFLTQLALNAAFGVVIGVGVDHRRPQRPALGNAGDDFAFRALYRRDNLRRIPARASGCRGERVGDGPLDRCAFLYRRAHPRAGN